MKDLSAQIKARLQLCNQGINKGKYPAQEYKMLYSLAEFYLQKGGVREYPKVAAVCQDLKKLVEKYLKGDKQKLEWLDAQIEGIERRFLENEAAKKIHLNPTSVGTDAKAMFTQFEAIKDIKNVGLYKAELVKYREDIKERLKTIENLGISGQEELDETGAMSIQSYILYPYIVRKGYKALHYLT